VLDILRERLPPKGGVLHCYSEDAEYARRALDLNLYFSFAGISPTRTPAISTRRSACFPWTASSSNPRAPSWCPPTSAETEHARVPSDHRTFPGGYAGNAGGGSGRILWENSNRFFGLPA
jgi:TatD DNase family protein